LCAGAHETAALLNSHDVKIEPPEDPEAEEAHVEAPVFAHA